MVMKEYEYRGMKRLAKRLVFLDREGVDFSHNTGSPDGLPYVTTTVGREFFQPGDYLVSTEDGAVVRVYKKADFEPFAKEVAVAQPIQKDAPRGDNGAGDCGDVSRESEPRDGGGSVRVADGKAQVLAKTGDARRRGAAQRRAGDRKRNARKSVGKPKKSGSADSRHRA